MYNGKNFIIEPMGLEIFYKDLPSGKTFNQYKSLCLALKGDGWRLPTVKELSYMCTLSQLGVLGFSNEYYWSSKRECVYFPLGAKIYHDSSTTIGIRARPVRTVSL